MPAARHAVPLLLGVALLLGAATPVRAQGLEPLRDPGGMTWDVQYGGMVGDGTDDAFDGAFTLHVAGEQYYGSGTSDGRTATFDALTLAGSLSVHRRILVVERPAPGILILDAIENGGDSSREVEVRLESNLGSDGATTVVETFGSEGTAVGEETLGLVTDDEAPEGADPAVLQVFGAPGASVRPAVSLSYDDVRAVHQVVIPSDGRIVLATYSALFASREEARRVLSSFRPENVLSGVGDPGLVADLVNWTGAEGTTRDGRPSLPGLPVDRHAERDLVLLESGDRLLGTLLDQRIRLDSRLGEVEVGVDEVSGLVRGPDDDLGDGLVLTSGEIYRGRLLNEEIAFRLSAGTEIEVPVDRLHTVGRPASASDAPRSPEEPRGVLRLRTGDAVRADLAAGSLVMETDHGEVSVPADALASLELDWIRDGIERVVFPDGSTVSGILATTHVSFRTSRGVREVPVDWILRYVRERSRPLPEDRPRLETVQGDVLSGRPGVDTLRLLTAFGEVDLALADVRTLEVTGWRRVEVRLADGAQMNGRTVAETIPFRLGATGAVLDLPVSAIARLRIPPGSLDGSTSPPEEEDGR